MPEGPEVQIIADVLNNAVGDKGFIIEHISIEPTSKYYGKALDVSNIIGVELGSITAYGKKVLFNSAHHDYPVIISSLGLEGHWILIDDWMKAKSYPHVSFIFVLNNKASGKRDVNKKYLIYADSRHFGLLSIAHNDKEFQFFMKDVGPSWIQSSITLDQFLGVIRNRRFKADKRIVDFLVEQKYFSGIGNYMRSEILYLAKISPHRPLNTLSNTDIKHIYESIYIVIDDALKSNGHTLHSYFTPTGDTGGYSPIIYGRKFTDDEAHVEVVSEKDGSGRMFHWSPKVQR